MPPNNPSHSIQYHPFYRKECLDYFKKNYDLDPSTGIMALFFFINKSEYNKIGLVGFDLFEKGTPIYYFSRKEASKSLDYLWRRGSYDEKNRITFDSLHDFYKTQKYLIQTIQNNKHRKFIIYSNCMFPSDLENVTVY